MERITIKQFVEKHALNFRGRSIRERKDGLMDGDMLHFRVRFSQGRYGFSLYFSQGRGINHPPTSQDVLSCLASDAAGYENARSFEEWASEYGYDTDSRKAEKIFRSVKRQAEQLKRLLGDDSYQELLWHTELL